VQVATPHLQGGSVKRKSCLLHSGIWAGLQIALPKCRRDQRLLRSTSRPLAGPVPLQAVADAFHSAPARPGRSKRNRHTSGASVWLSAARRSTTDFPPPFAPFRSSAPLLLRRMPDRSTDALLNDHPRAISQFAGFLGLFAESSVAGRPLNANDKLVDHFVLNRHSCSSKHAH